MLGEEAGLGQDWMRRSWDVRQTGRFGAAVGAQRVLVGPDV